jgi:hypothetical protein
MCAWIFAQASSNSTFFGQCDMNFLSACPRRGKHMHTEHAKLQICETQGSASAIFLLPPGPLVGSLLNLIGIGG